jgi:hypothetical protein
VYQLLPLTLLTLTERALRYNRMSLQRPLIVRIFIKDEVLQVENNRQQRPDPDRSIGSCDWETLEKQYQQWVNPTTFSFDQASASRWVTRVPLDRIPSFSPQHPLNSL